MTYKVSVSNNSYSVKQASSPQFKVSAILGSGASDVGNLSDLDDVNISGVQNGYVLTYNSSTGQFVAANPDDILSSAVTDTNSPGLPQNFIDELDVDLDDKIDLDAGNF
jgi:hypothetical protein